VLRLTSLRPLCAIIFFNLSCNGHLVSTLATNNVVRAILSVLPPTYTSPSAAAAVAATPTFSRSAPTAALGFARGGFTTASTHETRPGSLFNLTAPPRVGSSSRLEPLNLAQVGVTRTVYLSCGFEHICRSCGSAAVMTCLRLSVVDSLLSQAGGSAAEEEFLPNDEELTAAVDALVLQLTVRALCNLRLVCPSATAVVAAADTASC
jgi:hypothetical protein